MSSSPELSATSGSDSESDTHSTGTPVEASIREMVLLPEDFSPTDLDVLIGRGKVARTHKGNQRLKDLIQFYLPEYAAAGSNKDEKSYIIKEIVRQIRKSSPEGGFVKLNKSKDNRWYEVGEFLAREKVSQTFRDAMGDSYSSSNPYKRKRRSIEKKHNAIKEVMKRSRRGSSPTSVLHPQQSWDTSSTSSPAGSKKVASTATPTATSPSPSLSTKKLMESMYHPGQIGFARRAMMQFGTMTPTGTMHHHHTMTTPPHMVHHQYPRSSSLPPMQHSPLLCMQQQQQQQEFAMPPDYHHLREQARRASMAADMMMMTHQHHCSHMMALRGAMP